MRKILLIVLGLGIMALPASALAETNPFWAAISKIVQDIMPGGEGSENFEQPPPEEEFQPEDFIDPREIQQVQREIKDLKKELTRLAKQARKLPNAGDIANEINNLLDQLNSFNSRIAEGVNVREAIQDFRDAQIWNELNSIRGKIEIPRELANWNKEVKKLERLLKQKKYQNLDINLDGVRAKVQEVQNSLSKVQDLYNAGEFEEAMEELNNLREEFSPWDISNVIQRTQEVMSKLGRIKSEEIRNQIKEIWAEVINNFNEGEYRVAWELMNESQQDVWGLINKALSVGKRKGPSRENFFQMTDKLEERLRDKAEEKKIKIQEMREKKQEQEDSPRPEPRTESRLPQRPGPQLAPTPASGPASSAGSEPAPVPVLGQPPAPAPAPAPEIQPAPQPTL